MNKEFYEEYCHDQFWQMCEECIWTKRIKAEKVKMLLQSSTQDKMRPEFQRWQKSAAGSKTKTECFGFYKPLF